LWCKLNGIITWSCKERRIPVRKGRTLCGLHVAFGDDKERRNTINIKVTYVYIECHLPSLPRFVVWGRSNDLVQFSLAQPTLLCACLRRYVKGSAASDLTQLWFNLHSLIKFPPKIFIAGRTKFWANALKFFSATKLLS